LSGGERQRVALARAFLRDAPVLILDEALTHLDAVTAQQVWEAVLRGARACAILVVTHRIAGLEAMDEILVLDQGVVTARGRHADLIQQDGLYRRMGERQQQTSFKP